MICSACHLWLRVAVGLSLSVLAVSLFFVACLGLIDPAAAKQADDLDPFGAPAPRSFWGLLCILGIGLFSLGAYLLSRGLTPPEAPPRPATFV
jgi:hypothetical protein